MNLMLRAKMVAGIWQEFLSIAREEAGSRVVDTNKLSHNRTSGFANKNYSFSTFVVGPSNALAYAAAQAVAQNPGCVYNPLFLFGGSGLGKTHLLHAIGQEIKTNNPKAIILY